MTAEANRETEIHSTAIVAKGAEFGHGVKIGPYSIVGASVKLGDDVVLDSHVVINGKTTIGARTRIWPFASIGTEPQDLKYNGEDAALECGEDNKFREYVNLSIGTEGGGGKTVIGSRNLMMVNVHVAHDCIVSDDCIFANNAALAGHVEVSRYAVLGGHSAVHQFSKIGSLAMLAGGAIVVQDVPPFITVAGNHAIPKGLNLTGLRRSKIPSSRLSEFKLMYKYLYRSDLSVEDAILKIESDVPKSDERDHFIEFLNSSNRGVCR